MASLAAKAATTLAPMGPRRGVPIRKATAIVTRAGTCDRTVKVRLGGETWNKKVKKFFKKPEEHLVHDPNNSLRMGDVIEIHSSFRTSKMKRFVVNKIIAPFGDPIDQRPHVPTPEEREAAKAVRREAKAQRKELRRTRTLLELQFEKSMEKLRKTLQVTGLNLEDAALRDKVAPIMQDQRV